MGMARWSHGPRPMALGQLALGSLAPWALAHAGSQGMVKTNPEKGSQNGACLVWGFFLDLVRVFCTYVEAPNSQNMVYEQQRKNGVSDFYLKDQIRSYQHMLGSISE